MIPRRIRALVQERLKRYPAVALVGPRQVGKTTLARTMARSYFDLEVEGDRTRLDIGWDQLCEGSGLVVLDEAQAHPVVFRRLRSAIDQKRQQKGRFLLLGSVGPGLMLDVSESLAGRLSVVELTPFLVAEIGRRRMEDLWLFGGYPDGGLLDPGQFPTWANDYLMLLAQRDLPVWGLPATPTVTARLFRMLAAVHGQEWNASALGQSLGLSYHTVNRYLEHLEHAFLIRRLQPFHANLKKRLVKRPKVYWRDSGLLHAQLRVRDHDHLLAQPWVGASWEGFVIEQAIGLLQSRGTGFEPYFVRTSDRHEIDLLLDFGHAKWAVEVKLTTNPSSEDLQRLEKIAKLVGVDRSILVSQVRRSAESGDRVSCNLRRLLTLLDELPR